ncbi:MAG: S1/P1 nuclease, partial [Pseudomonadota bacterium]|nr:S1/P1 nuclease [Pseudomonadota bacterium]
TWQASTPLSWAVESQNLRSKIYAYGQLEGNGNVELSSSYVSASKNIVELRIVQAGIRLAGLLNAIDCVGPLKKRDDSS